MKTLPRITIITPSYNQGQFIEETILSVLEQNYPNLEYIIIDGGSEDQSVEVIKKYSKYIYYWESKRDNGQSHAINKGLKISTGEIFNWINSDDLLAENSLFNISSEYIKNPSLKLLCGYSRIFDDKNHFNDFYHRTKIFDNTEETIYREIINQQGMFYKLDAVKEIGGLNESLNFVMDLELWFRYLCKNGVRNIKVTDDVYGHFRYHSNSKTVNLETKFSEERKEVFHYLFNAIGIPQEISQFHSSEIKSYIPLNWGNIESLNIKIFEKILLKKYMFDYYRKGDFRNARKALKLNLFNNYNFLKYSFISLAKKLYFKN